MTTAQALETIRGLAAANPIRLVPHATLRANQRGASFAHIQCALTRATECKENAARPDSWKVSGPDLDGDETTCVCVIEDAVVVITLY